MAHSAARRRGEPGDEADHGLGHLGLDELRGRLLGAAANLTDHDDPSGRRILFKRRQAIDKVGAVNRVPTDADAGRLSDPLVGQLVHHLVG